MNTVLSFLLTLGVLIAVHEYGHYRVARWCGVRVLRFSIGFGPVLWRRSPTPGGTEFTLSALPLGGYVKMLDSREMPVGEHERALAFDLQPLRSRVAIVAAGPLANLGLAVLLFAAAQWWGMQEPLPIIAAPAAGSAAERAGLQAGDQVLAVSPASGQWEATPSMTELRWHLSQALLDGRDLRLQVADGSGAHRRTVDLPLQALAGSEPDADTLARVGLGIPYSEPVLGEIKPAGAAARAGLHEGDRVLTVDGVSVVDAQSLRLRIRQSAAREAEPVMRWQIERAGQRLELDVRPAQVKDAQGANIGRIDAFVGQPPATTLVRQGLLDGLQRGFSRTAEVAGLSLRMMGRMLIGEASLRNLSGPLTIADYAGQSTRLGVAYYLGFLALVSVSLGVLNLLPLPMLDGGHLIYYVYEGLTGRPVPDLWLKWLQRGGAAVLLMMMSIALSNDVARLLGLQ
ncbi:RIP metalloprotease RseP [Ideonella sp.]|uniref:RIP metalloprotease RseP n=1 Tax=Ideonella sp. TaxID=1929293 RepID=UPI003BB74298